jgi:hypothetical protein
MTAANPPEASQRRADRLAIFVTVRIVAPVEALTQSIDIGPGGVGLRSGVSLASETRVVLEFFGGSVAVEGVVRWCQAVGSGFRLGIQFEGDQSALIRRLTTSPASNPQQAASGN